MIRQADSGSSTESLTKLELRTFASLRKFLRFWDFFEGVLSEMIEFKDSGQRIETDYFYSRLFTCSNAAGAHKSLKISSILHSSGLG